MENRSGIQAEILKFINMDVRVYNNLKAIDLDVNNRVCYLVTVMREYKIIFIYENTIQSCPILYVPI